MLAFVVLLFSQLAGATGGGMVDTGGGASEMAVVYAKQNYLVLVEPCLRSNVCGLTADESSLLASVQLELGSELRFLPKEDLGQQLYSTGPNHDDAILINKAKLWKAGPAGEAIAYSVSDGLELLTQAMADHVRGVSGSVKISLSTKIALYVGNQRSTYLVFLASPNLRSITLKTEAGDVPLIDDGIDRFVNLQDQIAQQAGCEISRLTVFPLQWSPVVRLGDSLRTLLSGRIAFNCVGDAKLHRASISVVVGVAPVNGTVEQYWLDRQSPLKMVEEEPEVILSNIN